MSLLLVLLGFFLFHLYIDPLNRRLHELGLPLSVVRYVRARVRAQPREFGDAAPLVLRFNQRNEYIVIPRRSRRRVRIPLHPPPFPPFTTTPTSSLADVV